MNKGAKVLVMVARAKGVRELPAFMIYYINRMIL